MKNTYYLLIATAIAFTLSACSSDNDNFDPYKNQVKKTFYPTTITFENSNNDGAKTDKKWQLTYNAEGSIKAYKYDYTEDFCWNTDGNLHLFFRQNKIYGKDERYRFN